MVENLAKGVVKQFRLEELKDLPWDCSVTLLDARTPEEYAQGGVAGFRLILADELRDRPNEIEPGKSVYVLCQSGLRSYIACRILAGHGYDAYNFAGGFRYYDAVMNNRRLIEEATACGMDQR